MGKISDLIEELCGEGGGEEKVVKTIAMKPSWRKLWDTLQATTKQETQAIIDALEIIEPLRKKHLSEKQYFWATVENETGEYRNMRYNEDKDEIEVLEGGKPSQGDDLKEKFKKLQATLK